MDREASVWHSSGGTSEAHRQRDRSAHRGLRHDAAGDRHARRGISHCQTTPGNRQITWHEACLPERKLMHITAHIVAKSGHFQA